MHNESPYVKIIVPGPYRPLFGSPKISRQSASVLYPRLSLPELALTLYPRLRLQTQAPRSTSKLPALQPRMSYLLHGSTSYTGMGWVDLVPRCGRIYIGGLYALYQTDLIEAAGITHVLSVIDYDALLQEKFRHLRHFHIRAEDHPNTNLLQFFESGVKYIDEALTSPPLTPGNTKPHVADANISPSKGADGAPAGGGVFVHCAMGKSRSATLVCAYLIWKYNVSPEAALEQLCEGRPICDPNPGFKEQLEVWSAMCRAGSEGEKKRIYERWEKDRFTGEVCDWEAWVKEREREKGMSLQASKL